ncbi:hypothetical protein F5Y04DRAFT_249171 [Hypomontagnella monticulosa]|nr:hypothetical protein F5Y04DRAFT_249171 [Hypomontagnella monticulosa]
MSSITTAIPTGPIDKWCLGPRTFGDGQHLECANATKGTQQSDFQTFCCNGEIINSAGELETLRKNHTLHLANMVCCGVNSPLDNIPSSLAQQHTSCVQGTPTPLVSLAATNTDNAVNFAVTYTNLVWGGQTVGYFTPTEAPSCFWAYKVDAEMEEITLPKPEFTTPPPRPSSTLFIGSESAASAPSTTPSTTILTGTAPLPGSQTSDPATTTPSGAGSFTAGLQKKYLCIGLLLMAASLL